MAQYPPTQHRMVPQSRCDPASYPLYVTSSRQSTFALKTYHIKLYEQDQDGSKYFMRAKEPHKLRFWQLREHDRGASPIP